MEYKVTTLTKETEDELDSLLEKYQVPKTESGYRFLKQAIITRYLQPELKYHEICQLISDSNGTSAASVQVTLARMMAKVSKINDTKFSLSKFVNLCINSMDTYFDAEN